MLSLLDRAAASDTGDHGTLLRRGLKKCYLRPSDAVSGHVSVLVNRLPIMVIVAYLSRRPILCGDDPPTCESCGLQLSEAHISGMNQPAGHSCKIFHNLFYQRIVSKH